MGLIFSALTYLITFWKPIAIPQHGNAFRVKIAEDQLVIKDESGEQHLGHFAVLPNEMIVHLASYLDVLDILRLSSTCKLMYKFISSSNDIWNTTLKKLDLTSHQIQLLKSNTDQLSMKVLALRQYHELRILRPHFQDNVHAIKVAIFGSHQVGKTQLVNRLCGLPFDPVHKATMDTIESCTKFRCHDSFVAKVTFYDSPGSIDGSNLMSMIRNTHLILVVFDITQYETFLRCRHYFNTMEWALSNFHALLIGTHADCYNSKSKEGRSTKEHGEKMKQRQVSSDEAKDMAQGQGVHYFEISLKIGEGIPELLEHLVYHTRRFATFLRTYTAIDIRA